MVRKKKPKIIRDKLKDKKRRQKKKKKKKIEKKHNERILMGRIIRDIRALFELKEEDYYEYKRESNFWNNDDIE